MKRKEHNEDHPSPGSGAAFLRISQRRLGAGPGPHRRWRRGAGRMLRTRSRRTCCLCRSRSDNGQSTTRCRRTRYSRYRSDLGSDVRGLLQHLRSPRPWYPRTERHRYGSIRRRRQDTRHPRPQAAGRFFPRADQTLYQFYLRRPSALRRSAEFHCSVHAGRLRGD